MTHPSLPLSPAESTERPRERAAYEAPALRRLGSVRELTLNGGGSATDGTGLASKKGGGPR